MEGLGSDFYGQAIATLTIIMTDFPLHKIRVSSDCRSHSQSISTLDIAHFFLRTNHEYVLLSCTFHKKFETIRAEIMVVSE